MSRPPCRSSASAPVFTSQRAQVGRNLGSFSFEPPKPKRPLTSDVDSHIDRALCLSNIVEDGLQVACDNQHPARHHVEIVALLRRNPTEWAAARRARAVIASLVYGCASSTQHRIFFCTAGRIGDEGKTLRRNKPARGLFKVIAFTRSIRAPPRGSAVIDGVQSVQSRSRLHSDRRRSRSRKVEPPRPASSSRPFVEPHERHSTGKLAIFREAWQYSSARFLDQRVHAESTARVPVGDNASSGRSTFTPPAGRSKRHRTMRLDSRSTRNHLVVVRAVSRPAPTVRAEFRQGVEFLVDPTPTSTDGIARNQRRAVSWCDAAAV